MTDAAGHYTIDASGFPETTISGFDVQRVRAVAAGYFNYDVSSTNPPLLTVNPPFPGTYNFQMSSTGVIRAITIATNPAGLNIAVDGVAAVSPQLFSWQPSSAHTIATSTPQVPAAGTRYSFTGWSDGGAISHTITVPDSNAVYTASFATEYQLTTSASPSSGGSVTAGGFFNPGASVVITATPNSGFQFTGFSGDLSGTTNPQTIVMNGPRNVTANFALAVPTPDITVNPLSVNFGTIPVGSTSPELVVSIRNDGQANLSIGAISIVGTDSAQFQQFQDRCSSLTLAPNGSCTVSVRFKPTSRGTKAATLRIPSNDPDENPVNVSLNGGAGSATLVPDIDAAPSSLNFGNVPVKKRADQTLTISNTGTARLNLGQITLGEPNANQFSIVADKCSLKPLDPTKSCTVGIRFGPTSVNTNSAVVIIPSNDPDENPLNVPLTGTGTL